MSILDSIFGLFSRDLAMDLGTANTLIYAKGSGIILNEPSVVALVKDSDEVVAVGREAKEFVGRTPVTLTTIRPLKDGVIADFDVTSRMIKTFVRKALRTKSLFRPSMIVAVPTGITQVEKRAVIDAAVEAGVKKVDLLEEPMAAAIGAGLPINEPRGSMVVDIGGGTSEVAVISLSSIAYSESVRMAGDETNEAIIRYMQREHRIAIGENTAEEIKIRVGSAYPLKEPLSMEASGKELVEGIPKRFTITDSEVREAIKDLVEVFVDAVVRALEKTPPELAADISSQGVVLAGGGSLVRGLDTLLSDKTGLDFHLDSDPLTTVARGAGLVLENRKRYRGIFIN
jgi:rod shape-determining protein MreB